MDTRLGGVFATGDHADPGSALCARLPRARSMRRWTTTAASNVVPMAVPQNSGPNRHHTFRKGDDAYYTFNDESDIYPMRLTLKRKPPNNWSPFFAESAPHSVLCGPRVAITAFPDHAHEGDCIVPATLTAAEYPGGVAPEVIARGRNVVGRTKSGFTIVEPREFGLLGAYDGHLPAANVGCVLVNSTWHHWFNINLRGLDNFPHSVNYKDILAYLRNVAV